MGLTSTSTGIHAVDSGLEIRRQTPDEKVIAFAGNPNVGKSTLFNQLTGSRQHTGNWPGKTVSSAQGRCRTEKESYVLVDIPGTYSLMAHSAEEEVARDFICFGGADAVVVVCDATCLERNLNLVLQTMEISDKVLVCVNLMDEARRKHIAIDLTALSKKLGVPVAGTTATDRQTISAMMERLDGLVEADIQALPRHFAAAYPQAVEEAIAIVEPAVQSAFDLCRATSNPADDTPPLPNRQARWLALKLLDCDESLAASLTAWLGNDLRKDECLSAAVREAHSVLKASGIEPGQLKDCVVSSLVKAAESICHDVVERQPAQHRDLDRKIDRILTSRLGGYPVMIALLALVFWLTITGANYPSQLLSDGLFWIQDQLSRLLVYIGIPLWLHDLLVLGLYRVPAWVVAVMLPPMAIFFPLFTLLEDAGYLPRIAYNLDKPFKRCSACGKQALTMCMGFWHLHRAAHMAFCRIHLKASSTAT